MERVTSSSAASYIIWAILVLDLVLKSSANVEGDALNALKSNLLDPNNVLQSWDATLVNPCTWFHVTCNGDNSVTRVDLGNAELTGQLVSQLGNLPNLQYLELYSNNISGKIPEELGNLTNLVSLDLYLNKLSGNIPNTLGKLQKLRFLRLNNNSLTGPIPVSLTNVGSLQVLDLSNNKLVGDTPVNGSFSLFTPISYQNNPGLKPPNVNASGLLPPPSQASSGNSNTGAIAGGVAAGAALLFAVPAIALAYLRRRKPQDHFFDVPAEEDPEVHLGQLKRFSLRELQVATDNFSNKHILGRGGFGKVYKGRLADGTLVAVKRLKEERTQGGELQFQTEVEMISMAVHRNLLRLRGFCMTPTERLLVYPYMANGSVASCLRAKEDPEVRIGQLKKYSLRELQVATDNFNSKHILGKGSSGKVYKGRLADGSLVAVKRLKEERTGWEPGCWELQFRMDVEMISMAVHPNLLRLYGFCTTPTERLLVYPLMVNGSLATCLKESKPLLEWPMRKRIALGAARGLAYLHDHCDPKIIHRDVKAANILLDEEFEAVIGDFGLVKLMEHKDTHVTTDVCGTLGHIADTHVTTAVCGTLGHIAPEYLATGKFSEKTDVFGYGMMLLELITGRKAFDLARLANNEEEMLLDWVKGLVKDKRLETLVHADLQGNYDVEEVEQLIQVAILCTQGSYMERPKMSEVVRMLEGDGLAEKWEQWQKEEMFRQDFNNINMHHPNANWIVGSTSHIQADEL